MEFHEDVLKSFPGEEGFEALDFGSSEDEVPDDVGLDFEVAFIEPQLEASQEAELAVFEEEHFSQHDLSFPFQREVDLIVFPDDILHIDVALQFLEVLLHDIEVLLEVVGIIVQVEHAHHIFHFL